MPPAAPPPTAAAPPVEPLDPGNGGPRGGTSSRIGGRQGAGARQATLREHNLALVFAHVRQAVTPPSRAAIAAATGLTRATVSDLVDRLISAGLVRELDPVFSRKAGRPAVPLVPAGGTVAAIGVEANVNYLGLRAVDLTGEVICEEIRRGDYRQSDPQTALIDVVAMVQSARAELEAAHMSVAGLGLAIPGLVDSPSGPLRLAPNLGWRELDVIDVLHQVGLPTTVPIQLGNEADFGALAEAWHMSRAGHSEPNFIFVFGEIGIGGATVVNGRVLAGQHGWSGELGHVTVDMNGPVCTCGSTGCLEQYAGTDALMRAAGLPLDSAIETFVQLVETSEQARAAARMAARALGAALANHINLVDVSQVVLGGSYLELEPVLREDVERALRRRVLAAPWIELDVRRSLAGHTAAMTGAALAALHGVDANPSAWLARASGA